MAGTNPISGIGSIHGVGGMSSVARQGKAGGGVGDFANALKGYVNQVDSQQQSAAGAVQDLVAGKTDILPVVSEVAKADLSFKLLVGVRNKVIDAYKQTLNMQV